ncbi:hypothetical protein GCM10009810_16040 [Nostocoides vanveenii]|uniref:Uncharacterized protein n=1 Tax=Nostocoides vanveenii TaxID=330835 RepID=A0ABP4WTI8_9MICO
MSSAIPALSRPAGGLPPPDLITWFNAIGATAAPAAAAPIGVCESLPRYVGRQRPGVRRGQAPHAVCYQQDEHQTHAPAE